MWQEIIDWLQRNMQSCFYKKHFGVECPGCGTQRAIVKLLEGDVIGSIKMYPPLFLVLLLLSVFGLHMVFRFRHGGKILKYLAIATGLSMFLNYIYKIL